MLSGYVKLQFYVQRVDKVFVHILLFYLRNENSISRPVRY